MSEINPPFKSPPKKYQPQGLKILYEDRDIIVVNKINGLLTVSTNIEKKKTAVFLLNDYVRKGNPKSRNKVFVVRRLDRDTSGILVFAKSEKSKRYLQDNWAYFNKVYYAIVHGTLKEKEGEISSYLFENKIHKMVSVTDQKKGKPAKTAYKVLKESKNFSLLEINPLTNVKSQIRAHLSEHGHPIVGDKDYGKKDLSLKYLALHSAILTINHPFSKKSLTFKTDIPNYFKAAMKASNKK